MAMKPAKRNFIKLRRNKIECSESYKMPYTKCSSTTHLPLYLPMSLTIPTPFSTLSTSTCAALIAL
jgi:hypothetical protein